MQLRRLSYYSSFVLKVLQHRFSPLFLCLVSGHRHRSMVPHHSFSALFLCLVARQRHKSMVPHHSFSALFLCLVAGHRHRSMVPHHGFSPLFLCLAADQKQSRPGSLTPILRRSPRVKLKAIKQAVDGKTDEIRRKANVSSRHRGTYTSTCKADLAT